MFLDTTFRFFKICNEVKNEGKLILSDLSQAAVSVCLSGEAGPLRNDATNDQTSLKWPSRPGANAQLLEIDQVSLEMRGQR